MEENWLFLYLLVGVINLLILDSVDGGDGKIVFMELGMNGFGIVDVVGDGWSFLFGIVGGSFVEWFVVWGV